ncbi:uncharacterized protein [Elaeis guineensis]
MKEDWQWPSDDKPFRQGWMTKEDRRRKPATIGKKPGALAKWLLKEPRRSRGALIAVESKLEASKEKWSYGGVKEEIKKPNPRRRTDGREEKRLIELEGKGQTDSSMHIDRPDHILLSLLRTSSSLLPSRPSSYLPLPSFSQCPGRPLSHLPLPSASFSHPPPFPPPPPPAPVWSHPALPPTARPPSYLSLPSSQCPRRSPSHLNAPPPPLLLLLLLLPNSTVPPHPTSHLPPSHLPLPSSHLLLPSPQPHPPSHLLLLLPLLQSSSIYTCVCSWALKAERTWKGFGFWVSVCVKQWLPFDSLAVSQISEELFGTHSWVWSYYTVKRMSQENSKNKAAFVLKVGMHCTACRKKVDQLLHKIEGVEQVDIDAEEKMVTVSGNVDPAILLQTLKKAGNRAELWASEAGKNDDQLKDGKGQQEDNGKPKKGGGGRCKNMKLPHLKGPKFPFGRKDKKSVKFDLPPENSADEERGSDEERDHNEADDIHGDNEDNQNQDDDIDGDDEDNQNQGDDVDDDSEDNQNQGGGGGENGGGNNNKAAQPMLCPYMMAQGFHCMHLGRMGSMPHAPKSHMGNIPAGAVPAGYFHGGMAAPEMSAPSTNPYRQQYMAVMMDQQRMMMSGQTGGAANPPPPNGYGTPYAPRYVDHYTNMFSDENPNACSII